MGMGWGAIGRFTFPQGLKPQNASLFANAEDEYPGCPGKLGGRFFLLAPGLGDGASDYLFYGTKGLWAREAGAAGEADGTGRVLGQGAEFDAAIFEAWGCQGGDQGGAVTGGYQVDKRLEGGGLHGGLEAGFGSAGGEGVVGEAVAVGHDEEVIGEGGFFYRLLRGERVVRRERGQQGFMEEGDVGQFVGACGGGDERGVEAMTSEAFEKWAGLVFPEFDSEPWIRFLQRSEDQRQQIGSESGNDAEAERADERIASGAGNGLDLRGFGEGAAGVVEDLAADGGEVDALVGPFEEGDTEFFFEFAELAREGGLADVAGFGGASEVAMFDDGGEVAEFLKVHVGSVGALLEGFSGQ
jgi:hypothetical protein